MLLLFFMFNNCNSIDRYLQNRTRDAVDIPVLGVEEKIYGFSAWVWCFGGGMQYAKNGMGIGIRSGVVGNYKTGGKGGSIYVATFENSNLALSQGNSLIVLNSNSHLPKADKIRSNKKAFSKFNTNIIFPLGASKSSSGEIQSKWCDSPVSVEVSFGIYYEFRLGMNFSEAFDFLLGFTTIDMQVDDDIE